MAGNGELDHVTQGAPIRVARTKMMQTGQVVRMRAHEAPFFAEGYERPIENGICFTIERGIYIEGIGGFRHSDTIDR